MQSIVKQQYLGCHKAQRDEVCHLVGDGLVLVAQIACLQEL
jgi:hypothetical protein